MEPSDAGYKCEPSGNQSATRGHHATVLGKGVAQQDTKEPIKALFFMNGALTSALLPSRAAFALHRAKAIKRIKMYNYASACILPKQKRP